MNSNATVNIATILGIRRGEFVEIILVNFPAESFTEVENRPNISPFTMSATDGRITYALINIGLI